MTVRPAGRDPWPVVGLACAIAFVILAVLVNQRGPFAFDETIGDAVRELPIPPDVWLACTELGGLLLLPIGIAFTLAALTTGRFRLALILAVVLIASALVTDLVKGYVARPRPPDGVVTATGYSFPSGHTLSSTATYGVMALVTWRTRIAAAIRRLAVVAGVALPFVVGLSRIALGVHYPTDVLGGWLAGTALVALAAVLISATGALARDWPRRAADPADGA